jgi:patatin-like phospholipase/acyl hydrolase
MSILFGGYQVKRILAIDGGGIKGVFAASFLASIEETTGRNISDYFDLIVGTSTGGILALGLGTGFSATEYGGDIFEVQKFGWLKKWFVCQYNQCCLKTALEEKLGADLILGHSQKRLVVPAFNLDTGQVHVYKTSHHPRLEYDYKCKVVDIALATSAAPTYFQSFRASNGIPLIDGGVYANNPVGMAVVEAISVLNWHRDQLSVLSLGCTSEPLDIRQHTKGRLYWALKGTEVFLKAQSSLSLGTAVLLAGHDNIKRIDPIVSNNRFALDKIKEIGSLKGLGIAEARSHLPYLRQMFQFDTVVDKFEPYNRIKEN